MIRRYRSAERLLSRGQLQKRIGKPGQASSPNGKKLNVQANKTATFVKRCCRVREAKHSLQIDDRAIVGLSDDVSRGHDRMPGSSKAPQVEIRQVFCSLGGTPLHRPVRT